MIIARLAPRTIPPPRIRSRDKTVILGDGQIMWSLEGMVGFGGIGGRTCNMAVKADGGIKSKEIFKLWLKHYGISITMKVMRIENSD